MRFVHLGVSLWICALLFAARKCAGSPAPTDTCHTTMLTASIGALDGGADSSCSQTFGATRGDHSVLLCPASLHLLPNTFLSLQVSFARGWGSQLSVHSLGEASHGGSFFFHREAHGMSSRRLMISWTYSDGHAMECCWTHTLSINFAGFPAAQHLETPSLFQQDFAAWRSNGVLVSSFALSTQRKVSRSLGLLSRSPLSVSNPFFADATCKVRVEGSGKALLNFVDPQGTIQASQLVDSMQTAGTVDCAAMPTVAGANVQAASLRGVVKASFVQGFEAAAPVYSAVDWARWTGWDPSGLNVTRSNHVAQLNATLFRRAYTANVQRTFQQFRAFWFAQATSVSQLVEQYKARQVDAGHVFKYLSATLGRVVAQEYEDWLLGQKRDGRSTDDLQVPWEEFAAFSTVDQALDESLGAAWRLQETRHKDLNCFYNGVDITWDSFGAAPLAGDFFNNGWNVGTQCDVANKWHEKVNDLLLPMVHFSGLTSTKLLRETRAHVGRSLTATFASLKVAKNFSKLWESTDLFFIDNRLEIQLLYLSIINLHAAFILKSGAIMRKRGAWLPSDEITDDDLYNGRYTDTWLRDYLDSASTLLLQRTRAFGINELLGPYNDLQFMNGAQLWLYAATQTVADVADELQSIVWSNLALHYSPSVKDVSIPVPRQLINAVTGTYLGWSTFERQLFVSSMGPDLCKHSAGCAPGFVAPLWDDKKAGSVDMPRIAMYSMLISGSGAPPLLSLQSKSAIFFSAAKAAQTIFQRCTPFMNGDRTNFVAANYTIGSSVWTLEWGAAGMPIAARLGGLPAKPAAESYESGLTNPPTPPLQLVEQLPMIRIGSEQEDNLFSSAQGYPAVTFLRSYPVSAQYQSFMLMTQMAFPGQKSGDYQWPPGVRPDYPLEDKALQSDLLLPLFVDGGVWVSNKEQAAFRLPDTPGSCTVIPLYPNPIFTVRHGAATVGVRLLLSESSPASNIQDATIIRSCTQVEADLSVAGSGTQPFSVMWRVDKNDGKGEGHNLGVGRVVVAHVRKGFRARRAFYSAWLVGGGATHSEAERVSLQDVLMNAVSTHSMQNYSSWSDWGDLTNWDSAKRLFTPPGCTFNMSVTIAGEHTLKVSRTDYYGGTEYQIPLGSSPSPSQILLEPFNAYGDEFRQTYYYGPIASAFNRWVDGALVATPVDATPSVTSWSETELFQPHLARKQSLHARFSHARAKSQLHAKANSLIADA